MSARILKVMFLCTGNSARSILAEAALTRMGAGRFRAFSAGSHPVGRVHPLALEYLANLSFDLDFARSKSWDEFAAASAPVMDFVITVCDNAAGETCPIWPGHPMTAHWGVADPAVAGGILDAQRLAFADTYELLAARIAEFAELPFEDMHAGTFKARLGAIGKAR